LDSCASACRGAASSKLGNLVIETEWVVLTGKSKC
jgi:hypothetical protein